MRWFSHSGDLGDIIYSLPTIRACGGGTLFLFDQPGKTSHGMTEAKVQRLRPLLEMQPYIDAVIWDPNCEDHNLNGFRDHMGPNGHGVNTDAHLSTHGLDWTHRIEPWIIVDRPEHVADVIIHRSFRYRNNTFAWGNAVDKYRGRIAFVGFPEEHADFCNHFGYVPFYCAKDFLELARVIAGSQWFIGNASSPIAVAHAMKHPTVTEVEIGGSQNQCWFQRANHIFGWNGQVEWPNLS